MENTESQTRVIITGPESTGKTALCCDLARHYKGIVIPEYARTYISALGRKYTYNDVVHIALKQLEQMKEKRNLKAPFLFVDTYLIITKVWLRRVFGEVPGWIDQEIRNTYDALYLLCEPDIPWEPDSVRENGGFMRTVLLNEYLDELKNARLNYYFINGIGEKRLNCAIEKVNKFIVR